MSSANKRTCQYIFSGRSFMYRRNSKGPRKALWGTPEFTGIRPADPVTTV